MWLTSRTVNGQAIDYARDRDGRITRVGAMTLTPDPATGLQTGATLGGLTSTWGYNGFAEVNAVRTAFNASGLYEIAYTRDKLGRVSHKVETIGGVTATYDYRYDLAGHLVEVQLNGTVIEAYTYDNNGNRLTATTPGGTIGATYDTRDRLVQQGGAAYTYTTEGELRTRTKGNQTTTYTYDPLGALLTVALPDGRTVDYPTDGQNRRVGKRVNGTSVQGFLYAGERIVAELDGAGNVVGTFVYADGLVPAYIQKGGTNYRLVIDQVGSVRLVVNATTGQVVQRLDYDAWGRVTLDSNPGFQPFGFAGGLYDRDTGLVRFGARDYDPETGRWTAKDPILFDGDQSNLYAYVGDDPINRLDPSGRSWDYWLVMPDGQRAGIDGQNFFDPTTGQIALMDGSVLPPQVEAQYQDGTTKLWSLPQGLCLEKMSLIEQAQHNMGIGKAWATVKKFLAGGDAKFEVQNERAVAGVRG